MINPIDPSLPRKKDDRRAKVLLVVGDGFTQSFLQSQSLASSIPCRMNDLFPAASCVEYVPVQHDQFTRGPLWDPSKFPSVVNAWNAGGMNPWDFVSQFAKSGPMNNAVSLGSWSFKTASPEYQLRAYLWHYFRWVNEALSQSKHDFSRWKWSAPLSFLANSFNLSCVSYNYDCFLETAVSTLGAVRLGCPVERVVQFHDCLPERDTLVLKPHGSATFGNFFQMLPREDSANLWLEDVAFERNGGNDWETVVRRQHDCFPTLPDLVPPGHSYEHLSNPMSETRLAAELFATLADFVVFCGLSGKGPDEPEVKAFMQKLSPNCIRFHIGLDADRSTPVAAGLGSASGRYYFVHADDVLDLPQKILDAGRAHGLPTKPI